MTGFDVLEIVAWARDDWSMWRWNLAWALGIIGAFLVVLAIAGGIAFLEIYFAERRRRRAIPVARVVP